MEARKDGAELSGHRNGPSRDTNPGGPSLGGGFLRCCCPCLQVGEGLSQILQRFLRVLGVATSFFVHSDCA